MTSFTITCDEENGLHRAAVWEGKTLCDLFLARQDQPDYTDAVVRGRIVRTLSGGHAAFVDGGLPEHLYIESKTALKSGEALFVRVLAPLGEGKAWAGKVEKGGCETPPPPVWQRALDTLGSQSGATVLRFGDKRAYAAFVESGLAGRAVLEGKEPVHPQLEELIDALLLPEVPLVGGASLIIEPTAALIAIDVNGGASRNAAATNLLAVRQAARQIRLRNLSGIIVIDCLKMESRADASKVVNAFTRAAQDDPQTVYCHGLNKLGLLEATRTRVGLPLSRILRDV